jgi:fibronectin-binding autotransporter adhesin
MGETMNFGGGRTNGGKRVKMIWLVAAAATSLSCITSALAVVPSPPVTWDATGTADYNVGTNWNPDLAGPPTNADNQFLTINNGATAAINSDAEGAFLILGLSTGQSGNLVINSGTSTFGELRVGGRETVPDDYTTWATTSPNNGGTGAVVQNPGTTVNITYRAVDNTEPPVQSMYIGDSSGLAGNTASGSYTITGSEALPSTLLSGIANNDGITVGTGIGTVGTFTQNAFTTVTSTGFVNVGRRGSTGTYNLNGGTLNAQAGSTSTALFVGDGDTDHIQTTSGTFNQTGGTFNATGAAIVGRRGGDGFYNLSGGNLVVNGGGTGLNIGDGVDATNAASTSGTFTQTGGTVTTSAVLVGRRSGLGLYKISGGSLTSSGDIRVPDIGSSTDANLFAAQGTLEVSGTASVTAGANINIGLGNANIAGSVVGTVNMTAGSIVFTAAAPIFAVGNGLGATATVNQSGGTVDMNAAANTGASNLDLGRNNASGTYNLSGTGVVNAKTITMESGLTTGTASRIFNVSGGTLTATTVNFGTGVPTAGATTIRQLNVSGGNVTIGTLTTGQNATTYVSGGTFSITNNLSLTSNSTLRTSIPLTLTSPIALGTATIQVDSSALNLSGTISGVGNLTKTGAGTLIFSGTNTSTAGGTTVSGGRLELSAATAALNPGSNVTVSGAASGTSLAIDSGVANGIADTATLSLAGAGPSTFGFADLGAGVNEKVAALSLGGTPQSFGLTYGSLSSSAAIKSDVYFAGTGIVTVGLAGDYNHSGGVEAGDYVMWRKNTASFGGSAGYNLWRQNFGNGGPGAGSGLGGNQAVPEPGTLLLAVAGSLLACAGRRRRK